MARFLPVSKEDLKKRGWNEFDIILVSGDAYVDHPAYGVAMIGRVLERAGYRVGIIPQPNWRTVDDFKRLGKPRLFFGITAGNLDSMVAHYTSHKKRRVKDAYSPGGKIGFRPDRATIVYANRIREAFHDTVIVVGGIEASLRRFAHYDWWGNEVRRSILLDSRADILVYGMGEKQVLEIARRLSHGEGLKGIRGTVVVSVSMPADDSAMREAGATRGNEAMEIPSYEEVRQDKKQFNAAFKAIYENQDPRRGKCVVQKHENRFVVQYPPAEPVAAEELDALYELPFARASHPVYDASGGVPGFETVKFSLVSHRGCPGQCSFCSLFMHQGRIIQSRTKESLVREAKLLAERKDFRGTISDIGGPTANLYKAHCDLWVRQGACRNRSCLTPSLCKNLKLGYGQCMDVYRTITKLAGVKHLFIESGLRYDLLTGEHAQEYLEHILRNHVSGQMKVAPEHTVDRILKIMNKPTFAVYEEFAKQFREATGKAGKKQYLVHYFISSHPGSTLRDALELSLALMKNNIYPEQIQDFMPLPLTLSGAIYHTEEHPFTGEKIYTAKTFSERKMQRALIQYRYPKNKESVIQALVLLKRKDLVKKFFHRG
ncbi:MAG TPA: YgiQ family radical SAM protein [Syntrophorhabdaceae bacterium]|nr:YgiQ family radical SAM protein [Syntrophorhabdaceae bacterium]